MSDLSDQSAFASEHYRDTSKLNARIQLYSRFSTNKCGWHRWVFDRFRLPLKCRILELGCGTGVLWQKNLDRIPEGWNITLSDTSPVMMKEAQENLRRGHMVVSFEVINAQAIPLDDNTFDVVIANHILFHVPDVAVVLSEICRVLKSNGRLYASTVSRSHMQELFEILDRCKPDAKPRVKVSHEAFVLENGRDHLCQWVSTVVLYRYENTLVVTDVDPLIAYVQSMGNRPVLAGENLLKFRRILQDELTLHGAIRITDTSGMFEAINEVSA